MESREQELETRAAKASLTLIHPPADSWVVIYHPDMMWDACVSLDGAERIIEANEPAPWAGEG